MTKKLYVAVVTLDGELQLIKSEYKRKQDFYSDLRGNGYKVKFISTEENFDVDSNKYHERCEKNRVRSNAIYRSHSKSAKEMKMTVKEFEKWLKSSK